MSDLPSLQPIHFVEDIESAEDFERKHTPHIAVARIEGKAHVTIDTGYYVAHPNEPGHFFNTIDVLVNGVPVAHFDGAAGVVDPHIELIMNIEPGSLITAIASCNLHGVWKAEEYIQP